MTPEPEPCGCRVERYLSVHREYINRIIYCPTHAAAFENKAEVERWKKGLHRSDPEQRYITRLQVENAVLLAALEDHHDHDDSWCFACHRALDECSAVAAIAKAKGDHA